MANKGGGGSGTKFWQGKYRPEDFIVPGQDNNGNSMRVWCRVQPLLDRAIDKLFASRRFPFMSKGDLIRWCVKIGVDTLENLEPVTGSVLIQAEAMAAMLREEQHQHAFMTVFDTMATTVNMHVQAQALGEARRVVHMMKMQVCRMEEGYWRERYMKEIESRFGYLLSGPGAGIGESEDHGPDKSVIDLHD